ncbi:hypothetical protein D9M68_517740 [compost metagenome]
MLSTQLIVGKTRVIQELGMTNQVRPAFEHGWANYLHNDPAILCPKNVRWPITLAAIAAGLTPQIEHSILNQIATGKVECCLQQRSLDLLPLPAPTTFVKRRNGTQRTGQGCREIHNRNHGLDRLLRITGEIDTATHGLADSIETDPVAQ